jgi:hypothetical protein
MLMRQMGLGACKVDQNAASPGLYSYTSWFLKALKITSNDYSRGVWATEVQDMVKKLMLLNPNPWFVKQGKAQTPDLQLHNGTTGDFWLERLSTSNSCRPY